MLLIVGSHRLSNLSLPPLDHRQFCLAYPRHHIAVSDCVDAASAAFFVGLNHDTPLKATVKMLPSLRPKEKLGKGKRERSKPASPPACWARNFTGK